VLLSARSESGKTNELLAIIVDFNLKLPNLIVSNVVVIIFLLWAVDDSVAAVDAALNAVP
jgi:hypothetical protein